MSARTAERLCALADLEPGTANFFLVDGHKICVVRFEDDAVYAVGDTCSHANVSLSEGEVDPLTRHIECWKHGSCFSLETGEPDTLPATKPVPTYEVVIDGDDVKVVLPT
ncbi:MAG: non-heme iron oxygenase ferredoxin subunit [Acidimicrobiales bacterium]